MVAPQIYEVKALTDAQKTIIKSSVPVLESSGLELTKAFYNYMLDTYPDVKPYFNESNQKTFRQPKILAFALLNYAKNIDDLTPLTDFVEQIVVKHVGLQIKPEHYPYVGISLITTMGKLLGDAATPEFVEAWSIAYGNLAQLLIDAEGKLYDAQDWHGFREFVVTKLQKECDDVTSVYFAPKDGGRIAKFAPGQYLSFRFTTPDSEIEKSREYSISQSYDDREYIISVKNIGVVSDYIANNLKVGDPIKVAPPAGRLTYKDTDKNIAVFAGGIGITPLISIVEKALADGKRVLMFNSNKSESSRPFKQWLTGLAKNDKIILNEFIGTRLVASDLDQYKFEDKEVYVLGPVEYMDFVRGELAERGVKTVHLEYFGPTVV